MIIKLGKVLIESYGEFKSNSILVVSFVLQTVEYLMLSLLIY